MEHILITRLKEKLKEVTDTPNWYENQHLCGQFCAYFNALKIAQLELFNGRRVCHNLLASNFIPTVKKWHGIDYPELQEMADFYEWE